MSDTRLTETLNRYINGKPCKPYGHCLADCNKQMSFVNPERKATSCGECQHFEKVLTRLAELEDKIENGTLVELPFIQKGQYGNRWYVYYRKNHGNRNITWKMYYSKDEAKKKLKELQNERN